MNNTDTFASHYLLELLHQFNEHNIEWLVLRNHELLPLANESKDVDILIHPDQINLAKKISIASAKKLNLDIIKSSNLDYLHSYVVVDQNTEGLSNIKLDLFIGLSWRGFDFLNSRKILDNKLIVNNLNIPRKGHESLIMVVYYLLYAKNIRKKYHTKIINNFKIDKSSFRELCNITFDNSITENIVALLEKGEVESLISLRKEITRKLISNSAYGIKKIPSLIKHFSSELRFKKKKGAFIVFLGPDGAGKSTILDSVVQYYASLGMCSSEIPGHFIPEQVPPLHKLFFAPKKLKNQDYTKPYQAKPVGNLSSTIRIFYYFLGFTFGYPLFIRGKRRQDNIVFYDRYFFDLIVDPKRYRINSNSNWVSTLFKLSKIPNQTIIILTSADNILKRKDELTREKIEELSESYTKISKKFKNQKIIRNDGTLNEAVLETISIINKNLANNVKL